MKRIFLALIALALTSKTGLAQNNNLTSAVLYYQGYQKSKDPVELEKAKARIDSASKHPDTQNKAKTWYYRGEIYYATWVMNFLKLKDASKEADDKKKEAEAYCLVSVTELEQSILSYKKAIDLDAKKDYPDAKKKLGNYVDVYSSKGVKLYNAKKFEDAALYFEKSVEITQTYLGETDTVSLDNAALAYGKAKNYDKAASLYAKLIELKYKKEATYSLLLEVYTMKGDIDSYKSTLAKARTDFPNNYDFIIDEINISLKEGKSEQAITNLKAAIEKDPSNVQLYLVLGQTYTKMAFPKDANGKDLPKPGNFNELTKSAEEAFNKAYALKPDDFKVNYSFGAYFNNLGAGKMKEAQDEKDMNKAKKLEDEAVEILKKAIPYLEKAHELDKTDKDTMKALKQLYAKTGQADSPKYKELEDLLKN